MFRPANTLLGRTTSAPFHRPPSVCRSIFSEHSHHYSATAATPTTTPGSKPFIHLYLNVLPIIHHPPLARSPLLPPQMDKCNAWPIVLPCHRSRSPHTLFLHAHHTLHHSTRCLSRCVPPRIPCPQYSLPRRRSLSRRVCGRTLAKPHPALQLLSQEMKSRQHNFSTLATSNKPVKSENVT